MAAPNYENFDDEFASPAQWAAMYRHYGLQIIPGYMPGETKSWKRPLLAEWQPLQQALVPEASFRRWYDPVKGEYRNRRNMGIISGACSGGVFVLDLDIHKKPEAMVWWRGVLAVHSNGMEPETPRQQTGGGGLQILFRAPAHWPAPTNKTSIGVDIRGQGGFAVMPSSIHDSGHVYQWLPGLAPWEVSFLEAPQWLCDEIDKLVGVQPQFTETGPERTRASGETADNMSAKSTSGGDFDDFGNRVDGREEAMRDQIWAAMTGFYLTSPIPPGLAELEAEWLIYERRTKTRLNVADNAAGLEQEGRGRTLFEQKWRYALKRWDTDIKRAAGERKAAEDAEAPRASEPPPGAGAGAGQAHTNAHAGQAKPAGAVIPLVSAFPIDEASIPVRDWIVPGLLLRRNLSVLVAPPGSGKSLLTLQVAIMVATGMSWGGWAPRKPEKVLVVNSEDDINEMRRRLVAAAKLMGVDQATLVDRILLVEAPENIVIARMDARSKSIVRTPLVETLIQTITANGIGCAIVDPFAETFEGDENSNSEVKWAGILWREVARRTGISLKLVHHTRKYAGGMAGDADASRGGGALIGTARILSTLFVMTEEEAAFMDVPVEERTQYVRFDDAKANFSKVEAARWFKKESVTLNNSTGFIPGDEVGVLVPWTPPDALSGMSMREIGMVLDTIDRGVPGDDGQPSGQFYAGTVTSSSKDRWAGKVLTRVTQCSEAAAKNIIKTWIKNDVLEVFEYKDPLQRKFRKGVRSVFQNRPDRGGTET